MRVRGLTLVAIAALVFGACSSTPAAHHAHRRAAAASAAPSAGCSLPRHHPRPPLDCGRAAGRQPASSTLHDHATTSRPASTRSASRRATSSCVFQLLYNTPREARRDREDRSRASPTAGTSSPDATTFTFHLNKNAKWSDGQPVTADDVRLHGAPKPQKDEDIYITNGTYPITAWLATKTVEAVDAEHRQVHARRAELGVPREPDRPGPHDHAQAPPSGTRPATHAQGERLQQRARASIGSGPYKLVVLHAGPGRRARPRTRTTSRAPRRSRKIFYRLKVSPDTAAAQLQSGELGLVARAQADRLRRSSRAPRASRPSRSPASASRRSST